MAIRIAAPFAKRPLCLRHISPLEKTPAQQGKAGPPRQWAPELCRLALLRRDLAPGGEGQLILPQIKTGLRRGNLIRHAVLNMAQCVDWGLLRRPFAFQIARQGRQARAGAADVTVPAQDAHRRHDDR